MIKKLYCACLCIYGVLAHCGLTYGDTTADNIDAQANLDPQEKVSFSGYLESYYVRDFNGPANHKRPDFIYSHNRANDWSINLAMLKASLNTQHVRGNLALASGSYMRANYAAEPRDLQNIFEANAGVRLSSVHDVWLDAGVMPSHLGFESAVGSENWTLTRSLMAENSPYFETGAKITYTSADGKWMASGLILNGWQRIRGPRGNTTPSIGHQLTYKPNERVTLNSSSFIGNDKSDRDRQMRYFHDFYGIFKLDDQWSLITALDIGAEEKPAGEAGYHIWLAPAILAKYQYSSQFSVTGRLEYYQDKNGVIIHTDTPNGFKVLGYSVNADYKICPRITLRAELRQLQSRDDLFNTSGSRLTDNSLTASTAIAFQF